MALTLILIRHGQAESQKTGDDFGRKLTDIGQKEASKIPDFLANHALIPNVCLISPAVRTKETAAAILKVLALKNVHQVEVPAIYRADPQTLLEILENAPNVPSIMMIGHNPAITALTSLFKIKNRYTPIYNKAMNFEITAKAVVISFDADSWADISTTPAKIMDVFYP